MRKNDGSQSLSAEDSKDAFNPDAGDGPGTGTGVEANKPYFSSWRKVTEGLQVDPDEKLDDAIWRHLRVQKGVGTGFGGGALYSDHLAVVSEVEVTDLSDSHRRDERSGRGRQENPPRPQPTRDTISASLKRIGVCSFNISFQISDPGMWDKLFPSELAATAVLNRQHAEAVAVAGATIEN